LVVVPLVQWDETFLGTSLVRDAGDANRTAATVAAQFNSRHAAIAAAEYLGREWTPDSVDAAVEASVVDQTNVVEVVSRSSDPVRALRAVEGFSQAVMADRWQRIAKELDARIAALSAIDGTRGDTDAGSGEIDARLATLQATRQAGADPTVRVDSTGPVVRSDPPPAWMVGSLSVAGGLLVGLLAAVGWARTKRRLDITYASTNSGGVTPLQSTPAMRR
jgi:hypothetical protein